MTLKTVTFFGVPADMKRTIILAALLTACAPLPPLQSGPYWFKSGTPSALPEYVEYSYRIPADCPAPPGLYGGFACGPAVRDGKGVFLIWIDSSLSKPDQNCVLNHERAHKAGWFHAQRAPNNIAEHCAYEIGDFK